MNKMKYRGYTARIEFDEVDRIFVGHLAGIRDIVGFHGTTVDELESAFRESVDHYIAVGEEQGRPAQKPYSGRLMLRVPLRFTPPLPRLPHTREEHQPVGLRSAWQGGIAELTAPGMLRWPQTPVPRSPDLRFLFVAAVAAGSDHMGALPPEEPTLQVPRPVVLSERLPELPDDVASDVAGAAGDEHVF